jgi:hypothetical protein
MERRSTPSKCLYDFIDDRARIPRRIAPVVETSMGGELCLPKLGTVLTKILSVVYGLD